MKDANGYTLHPAFGHKRVDPDVCPHPITAQFVTRYIDYRLVRGKQRAANCLHTRCFACGTVLSDAAHTWCDTGRLVTNANR